MNGQIDIGEIRKVVKIFLDNGRSSGVDDLPYDVLKSEDVELPICQFAVRGS